MLDDTICAPATPPVNSPIAIIRISGSGTFRAISSLFSPSGELKPRHAHYGTLVDRNGPIDDAVVIYYRSPQSYTGEDMAEILCHGNPIIVGKIITLLNNRGVRMAEPGEFTKRAFLSGKVDLTEAEAINHIITAKSEWEIETSLRQMHGSLRNIIEDIRRNIIRLMSDIEAGIDFSDQEIDIISPEAALSAVEHIRASIEDLMSRCKTGERLSHGIDVTIIGKPNVGKSSILNLLLNEERAIVSSIPGTTRDIIRETLQIAGMLVNLNDTAGIDAPGDELERIGIDLSHRKIEASHFIVMVLDASVGMSEADWTILGKTQNKKRVILINKIDIARPEDIAAMQRELPEEAILFSAMTGEGLRNLKDTVAHRLKVEFVEMGNSFIADMRIISLLEQSIDIVKRTSGLIIGREPGEIISFELRALIDALAEITGEITPDHILDSVFNRFCIGK